MLFHHMVTYKILSFDLISDVLLTSFFNCLWSDVIFLELEDPDEGGLGSDGDIVALIEGVGDQVGSSLSIVGDSGLSDCAIEAAPESASDELFVAWAAVSSSTSGGPPSQGGK